MSGKHVVLASLETRAADRCVDIFVRADGTFGFEEFRRDAEDGGPWRCLDRHAQRSFSTQHEALEAADASVPWLARRDE